MEPLAQLLSRIQQIQSIMIGVATDYLNYRIPEQEKDYVALYDEISLELELLEEDGIQVSNQNDFKSLWDWHRHYKTYLAGASSIRRCVYELYLNVIDKIEDELYKNNHKAAPESTLSVLALTELEDLVLKIKKLKSMMIAVTSGTPIDQEEFGYIELYQQIASKLGSLRCLGIPAKNPNVFRSLWHWHSFYSDELDPSLRREYVDNLYADTVTSIEKALLKQRRSSKPNEQFIEDLQRRFNEQVSKQSLASTTTSGIIEQNTSIGADDVPAGSTQVLEPDSTRSISLQPSASSSTPKVFISYSHDSQGHKDQVFKLAARLQQDGIDCKIDQHEDSPLEGWPHWMLNQIEAADFVLMVCTEQYERRFRAREEVGKGRGVTWEGSIIIQQLYEAQGKNSKFIPIVFTPEDAGFIPSLLRGATVYGVYIADEYESLSCRLQKQPRTCQPTVDELSRFASRDHEQLSPESSPTADKRFSTSDRSELADLLKRSGRADSTSRRSLCWTLDLDPGDLSFVALSYSDKDFAIELVNYLFKVGRDLTKLCDEVEPHLDGPYVQRLQIIRRKIQLETRSRK